MAEDFVKGVEDGLKLSKCLYYRKDRAVEPPIPMGQSSTFCLPTALWFTSSSLVQGSWIIPTLPATSLRCMAGANTPPPPTTLIPLLMNSIELQVDCYFDAVFLNISDTWRLHCVMSSYTPDCRIALSMGHQVSRLVVLESHILHNWLLWKTTSTRKMLFELKLEAFSNLIFLPWIYWSWSQKMLSSYGVFSLNVPFTFPDFINPPWKHMTKREKIQLNVNAGTGNELFCKATSHPLKEESCCAGSVGLFYDSNVFSWTKDN